MSCHVKRRTDRLSVELALACSLANFPFTKYTPHQFNCPNYNYAPPNTKHPLQNTKCLVMWRIYRLSDNGTRPCLQSCKLCSYKKGDMGQKMQFSTVKVFVLFRFEQKVNKSQSKSLIAFSNKKKESVGKVKIGQTVNHQTSFLFASYSLLNHNYKYKQK